jgi:hypothetical protein
MTRQQTTNPGILVWIHLSAISNALLIRIEQKFTLHDPASARLDSVFAVLFLLISTRLSWIPRIQLPSPLDMPSQPRLSTHIMDPDRELTLALRRSHAFGPFSIAYKVFLSAPNSSNQSDMDQDLL